MKNIIVLFLLLFIASTSFGQAAGNSRNSEDKSAYRLNPTTQRWERTSSPRPANAKSNSNQHTLLNIKILLNQEADTYVAIFHLSQVGARAGQADSLMNDRINGFKSKLAQLGITNESIFLDVLSFVPVYEYQVQRKLFSKKYLEIPKGFELKKNIHIRFKDEQVLDRIMTAAAQNEIYDFVRVNYFVENVEAAHKKMRAKALELIKARETYYRQLGIELDTLYRTISEGSSVAYPYESYAAYQAYANNNLLTEVKSGKVSRAKKAQTVYYKPMDYRSFDAVINPTIFKPVVQFSYNLHVNYERNKSKNNQNYKVKKQIEKQFYLIKPDGSLQFLDVSHR